MSIMSVIECAMYSLALCMCYRLCTRRWKRAVSLALLVAVALNAIAWYAIKIVQEQVVATDDWDNNVWRIIVGTVVQSIVVCLVGCIIAMRSDRSISVKRRLAGSAAIVVVCMSTGMVVLHECGIWTTIPRISIRLRQNVHEFWNKYSVTAIELKGDCARVVVLGQDAVVQESDLIRISGGIGLGDHARFRLWSMGPAPEADGGGHWLGIASDSRRDGGSIELSPTRARIMGEIGHEVTMNGEGRDSAGVKEIEVADYRRVVLRPPANANVRAYGAESGGLWITVTEGGTGAMHSIELCNPWTGEQLRVQGVSLIGDEFVVCNAEMGHSRYVCVYDIHNGRLSVVNNCCGSIVGTR